MGKRKAYLRECRYRFKPFGDSNLRFPKIPAAEHKPAIGKQAVRPDGLIALEVADLILDSV